MEAHEMLAMLRRAMGRDFQRQCIVLSPRMSRLIVREASEAIGCLSWFSTQGLLAVGSRSEQVGQLDYSDQTKWRIDDLLVAAGLNDEWMMVAWSDTEVAMIRRAAVQATIWTVFDDLSVESLTFIAFGLGDALVFMHDGEVLHVPLRPAANTHAP